MTDADKVPFAQAMSRLCVALREKEPDAAQYRVYFEALKDLDIEFIVLASERLAMKAEWFPKPADWRSAAGRIEGERTEQLRAVLRKLPTPLCAACEDTGWRSETSGGEDRWKHCECRQMRRLEVLGRRPMPALTEGPIEPTRAVDLPAVLARAKGMR